MSELQSSIENEEAQLEGLKARLEHVSLLTEDKVLRVGNALALTKGPPLNWVQGAPLAQHRPPYPTEDLMRSSLLFQTTNLAKSGQTSDESEEHVEQHIRHHAYQAIEHEPSFDILNLDLNPDLST